MTFKVCISCGIEKDAFKDFRKIESNYVGYDKTCFTCRSKQAKLRRDSKKKPTDRTGGAKLRPHPIVDRHLYCWFAWTFDRPGSLAKYVR